MQISHAPMRAAAPAPNTPPTPPAPQPEKPPEPEKPHGALDSVLEFFDDKKPMTITKLAINTALSAAGGAVVGNYIDAHAATAIGFNAGAYAAVGGLAGGLGGALLGGAMKGFRANDGAGKAALIGGSVGLAGGAALGAGIGAGAGALEFALNHVLPWTPAINGAVLAGGGTLISGAWKLAHQH